MYNVLLFSHMEEKQGREIKSYHSDNKLYIRFSRIQTSTLHRNVLLLINGTFLIHEIISGDQGLPALQSILWSTFPVCAQRTNNAWHLYSVHILCSNITHPASEQGDQGYFFRGLNHQAGEILRQHRFIWNLGHLQ